MSSFDEDELESATVARKALDMMDEPLLPAESVTTELRAYVRAFWHDDATMRKLFEALADRIDVLHERALHER